MQVDSYFPAGVPLSQAGDAGRQAAEAGFDAVWLTETRHNPFLSAPRPWRRRSTCGSAPGSPSRSPAARW